jgi:hypothetical protein
MTEAATKGNGSATARMRDAAAVIIAKRAMTSYKTSGRFVAYCIKGDLKLEAGD